MVYRLYNTHLVALGSFAYSHSHSHSFSFLSPSFKYLLRSFELLDWYYRHPSWPSMLIFISLLFFDDVADLNNPSLIAFHTYHSSRHSLLSPSTMIPRPNNHKRSLSSGNRSPSPDRTITKAKSTDGLFRFTTDNQPEPATRSTSVGGFPDSGFSTLKDPRLATSSDESETSSPLSHHPDLNDEVAALSLKLVQAINNQTNLDDSLVATRQELDQAQSLAQTLQLENDKYRRDIDQEVVIRKADADQEIAELREALAEEKSQRTVIERGKKTIEQELETLTAALFEEANKVNPFFSQTFHLNPPMFQNVSDIFIPDGRRCQA